MKLLFGYLKPFRGLILLAIFLAFMNQGFSLLDPQIFRLIVDNYASKIGATPPMQLAVFARGVGLLIAGFIGVAMMSRIAKNFQDYFVNVVSQSVGNRIYADGIRHSLQLPYRVFEDQQSGAVLQQLEKARNDSRDIIEQFVNTVFVSSVTLLIVLGYSFWLHWSIGAALIVMVPVLAALTSTLSRRIKKVQKKIFQETTSLAGSTTESLRNIELIKSLGLETQEIGRLNGVNAKILELELQKVKTVRVLMFSQGTVINFFRALLLLQLLALAYFHFITLGEFFSLMFYSFAMFSPLGELGGVISKYQETRASLDNFRRILSQKPEETNPGGATHNGIESIEFSHVGFRHPSSREPALSDISFSVRAGESIAFVGPSGAGKSTLVKLLLGLYRPDGGNILFNGTDSGAVYWDALRRRVGFVPQSIELFAGTIRENLLFVRPDATDAECGRALQAARLAGLLERSREGLDTRIGEGGLKLSGGERQRLAIARALLRNPDILIFDEATSSLDSETEKEITRTIEQIIGERSGFITVLIAHRLSTIAHADRIVVLRKGKLVEQGVHLELLRRKGLYYTLWRHQGSERLEIVGVPTGDGGAPVPV
jgi:ATP-binding cassette subfamily B protein